MPNVTKLALAAAIVLGTAAAASAATKPHRAGPGHHPPIYNAAPPIINDACQPVGPPCRTHVDSA
jgi:hypothetical protein